MRRRSARPRIALALAGGGPEGAIYEIGALRALAESVQGLDLCSLDIYVGVSAGAFIAANLANRISTIQMCRAILKQEPGEHPFTPENFFQPAYEEVVRRGRQAPRLVGAAIRDYLRRPGHPDVSGSWMKVSRSLPVALFDNEPIRAYLEKIYALKDRTDDFRQLSRQLFVVSADLEAGRPVRFGEAGFDHVPISRAVQASTALPGLYPPVEIDGRYYVDGVLLKTLHASVALDQGATLVLCINPIVPVDLGQGNRGAAQGYLLQHGLPSVLSQTFRTLIHSRLVVGLAAYQSRYPDADVVLFEPRPDDYRMFFTNIFAFSSRKAVCEHAYEVTRRQLWDWRQELQPMLERHGLSLRLETLEDTERDLWSGVGVSGGGRELGREHTLQRLGRSLDRLEELLSSREDAVRRAG